jgi:hypothetical protein
MSRRKWKCIDCGVDTGKIREHYYLEDAVWNKVAKKDQMLCVGCVESRLYRYLKSTDFTDCYLNKVNYGEKSERLISRIKGA